MSYNGWSNYETWNVALWLSNEQGAYNLQREWAADAVETHDGDKDAAIDEVAQCVRDFIEEGVPNLGASTYSDLLGAALSEVNWYEIAAHSVEDALAEREDAA